MRVRTFERYIPLIVHFLLSVSCQEERPGGGQGGINCEPEANLNLESHDVKKRAVEDLKPDETK